VTPTSLTRPRQGPKLAELITEPDTTRALGDSDLIEVLGSAYAATDGDPATAWTAPQHGVQYKSPPTLTLTLPRPTEVTGLRVLPSRSTLPAHPTMVAVDLGDGPQVQAVNPNSEAQTLSLHPRVTDTVTVSLLNWQDVIDRNSLGFDQLKPPGLAEVEALGADGNPIAAANAVRNRTRTVDVDCEHGPVIAVAGRFVHTSIRTTAGALLDGEPVAAMPCEPEPIVLPAGQQELLISPGPAFTVDGAQLTAAAELPSAAAAPAATGTWGPARREIRAPASSTARVLVIPESINPGWVARTSSGARLTPVTVNGWQQGWVVPAGDPGNITLTFASNSLYRVGLALGLALLPLLAVLALWRRRGSSDDGPPALTWSPGLWAVVAVFGAGVLIAGLPGFLVIGATTGLRYALRDRQRLRDGLTVGLSAGGLVLAGALLSRHPWRSADGYAGHSASVQLLALVSLAAVAASLVTAGQPQRSVDDA
jgi:arabinofuranan 3-O-arabinosyltransferase